MLAALVSASLALAPQAPDASARVVPERAFQIEVREFFSSRGAQPAYWASYARSDFDRRDGGSGVVDFTFELREIATVLGAEPEVQFAVEAGSDALTISQDPETQLLGMSAQSPIIEYINVATAALEQRQGRWVEKVVPFDGTVVPGAVCGALSLTCASEPLVIGETTYALLSYRSDEHRFSIDGVDMVMSYRGMAIVDPATGLAYHAIYEQQGKVFAAAGESEVSQRSVLTLVDPAQGGVVALDLPPRVRDQVNSYLLLQREDLEPLDPSIYDEQIRPEWSVDLWLAGRVGEARMGMAVEQATNPLPAAVIGSLVMTDQSIAFGASKLLQHRLVERGELGLDEVWDRRVPSPIERAYGAAGEELVDRLHILGPETTGVLKIDEEDAVVIGALLFLTRDHFGENGTGRRLEFATERLAGAVAGGTPAWAVIAGGDATPLAAVVAGGAAGGAGAVGAGAGWLVLGGAAVAVAGTGGGTGGGVNPGGVTAFTELQRTETFSQGCNSGQFQLRILDETPGRTWRIQGTGTITGSAGCPVSNTTWSETAQGTTSPNTVLTLTIQLPSHLCVDGTVTVTAGGVPASFQYEATTYQGSVTSSCF